MEDTASSYAGAGGCSSSQRAGSSGAADERKGAFAGTNHEMYQPVGEHDEFLVGVQGRVRHRADRGSL